MIKSLQNAHYLDIKFARVALCNHLLSEVHVPSSVVGELGMEAGGQEIILLDGNNAIFFVFQCS